MVQRVADEMTDHHHTGRMLRVCDIERRLIPDEAGVVIEAIVKGDRLIVELNDREQQPLTVAEVAGQLSIERLVARVEKQAWGVAVGPAADVLGEERVEMRLDLGRRGQVAAPQLAVALKVVEAPPHARLAQHLSRNILVPLDEQRGTDEMILDEHLVTAPLGDRSEVRSGARLRRHAVEVDDVP